MNNQFLGIDLGGTKMLLVYGKIEQKIPTGKEFNRENFKSAIQNFIQKNQLNIQGIGVAVPGLVQNNKIVECDVLPNLKGWSPDQDWNDLPFKVYLSNDIKAALSQEYGDVEDSFTGGVIMVGTGIGAALISDSKPMLGADGWAGEMGYFPIQYKGEVKRLDELSGGQYMADRLGMTSQEMVLEASIGNQKVLEVIREGGYYLGLALAGLINLLNPNEISIGGGTIRLPGYWEALLDSCQKNVIPQLWKSDMVQKVKSGEQIVALGAIKRMLQS